ncbi:MAG TPA: acetyl-CoA carboxylase biotin carboxyl carrier protein [Candidatus Baltobacteraceae bacterium]|nr:acetyl-CoA carboxylase biotin carboxyl carrier protein [Candidatus Baltobacteraceae bacterium]
MTLTAKDVAEILRLLESSTFDSLSLEMNGVKLNLQRGSSVPARVVPTSPAETHAVVESQPAQPVARKTRAASEVGLAEVASPLLGIFYRAPKPGEPPFVEVGSKVKEDTVVGIIEVMKLMNSVHAGVKGEVVEILAENAALVEYGEALLRVRLEV